MKESWEWRLIMGINVGMLIFGLFDGGLAFAIVFCLLRAWFHGKTIGRILGTIFGIIIFSVYIGLFVEMNTPGVRVNPDFRNIIYAAPIVLSVLLIILVLLCQPPKKKDKNAEVKGDEVVEETTASEEKL